MMQKEQWQGFEGRLWKEEINVRDFIQNNYTPYEGDSSFLADPTEATNQLWGKLQELQKEERAKGGVLDMETEVVSSLTAYGPGYICEELKDKEQVVGLQTDKPLKRALCRSVESKWLRKHAKLTDMNQTRNFIKSLQIIIKHITRQYLMPILRK